MNDIIFLIPIVAVPSLAAVVIAFSPLGKALAARRGPDQPDPALVDAIEQQRGRLEAAEDEIERLREKLEFHERLLEAPKATSAEAMPEPPAQV